MKVSIILLDWSVRESFHSIYYLNKQNIQRSEYELLWVEYYDRKIDVLEEYYFNGQLDKYIILKHKSGDYNKHLAWNKGVMEAAGDIVVLCDSDAMFSPDFIKSIVSFFNENDNSFLLIDEIRNNNKCFWPFSYPSWEKVMNTPGLANWDDKLKVTIGLTPAYNSIKLPDSLFHLNYGSCLCVKKNDYIRFGGLDEHETYTGYICGPYDLVVRMVNGGMEEHWHTEEFLLHTYHPWISSRRDKVGPHIRRNSLTSLKHWYDKDTMPYVGNTCIRSARKALFSEKLKKSIKVKFTIIVVDSISEYAIRMYDSIDRATEYPFELISVGKDSIALEESNARFVKMNGFCEDILLDICKTACGEFIILTPPEVIFKDGILDCFLDDGRQMYPVSFINTLETYTMGYSWSKRKHQRTSLISSIPLVASRETVSTISSINELVERAYICETNNCHLNKEVQAYMWQTDSTNINDEVMQALLDGIVRYNSYFVEDNFSESGEVKSIVDHINKIEKQSPGRFLKHCMWSYGLLEYYKFTGIFRRLNLEEYAILSLEILMNLDRVLEEFRLDNIEDLKDTLWLRKLFIDDMKNYLGLAHYHLGVYSLKHSNIEGAIVNMNKCLHYMPEHREARAFLKSNTYK